MVKHNEHNTKACHGLTVLLYVCGKCNRVREIQG